MGSPHHQFQYFRVRLDPEPRSIQRQRAHRYHCDGQGCRTWCLRHRSPVVSGTLLRPEVRIRLRGHDLPLLPAHGIFHCRSVQEIPRVAIEHDLAWRPRQLSVVRHPPQVVLPEGQETHVPPAFLRHRCCRQLRLVLVPRLYLHRLKLVQLGVLDRPKQRRREHPLWLCLRFRNGVPHFRLGNDFIHGKSLGRPRKSHPICFREPISDHLLSGGPKSTPWFRSCSGSGSSPQSSTSQTRGTPPISRFPPPKLTRTLVSHSTLSKSSPTASSMWRSTATTPPSSSPRRSSSTTA